MRTRSGPGLAALLALVVTLGACADDPLALTPPAQPPTDAGPAGDLHPPAMTEPDGSVMMPLGYTGTCPRDSASITSVKVRVHNAADADRIVSTSIGGRLHGWCMPYGITDDQGRERPYALGPDDPCGHDDGPGPVYSFWWHRLHPGESIDLTPWDGRALFACVTLALCNDFVGQAPVTALVPSSHPVPAGLYRITLAVESAPPANCTSQDGMNYTCGYDNSLPPGQVDFAQHRCPSTRTASADFTLPAAGQTSVTIDVD